MMLYSSVEDTDHYGIYRIMRPPLPYSNPFYNNSKPVASVCHTPASLVIALVHLKEKWQSK